MCALPAWERTRRRTTTLTPCRELTLHHSIIATLGLTTSAVSNIAKCGVGVSGACRCAQRCCKPLILQSCEPSMQFRWKISVEVRAMIVRRERFGTCVETKGTKLVPSSHVYTTNSPFRGFHIALRKGGEWAQDMTASSAPPSVSRAGETLCRKSRLIVMGLVV